jgi:thiol-disulfide isomerase/thioredoxin
MSLRSVSAAAAALMLCLCVGGRIAAEERASAPIHADLRQFLAEANAEGKILLVDFSGDWCPWCVKLDRTIADTDVQALIKERFHYVKLDVGNFDKHVECLKQYNIHGIPYLIAFDSSGRLMGSEAETRKSRSERVGPEGHLRILDGRAGASAIISNSFVLIRGASLVDTNHPGG